MVDPRTPRPAAPSARVLECLRLRPPRRERDIEQARATFLIVQAHARAMRARLERARRVLSNGSLQALAFRVRLQGDLASAQDDATRALSRWSRLTQLELAPWVAP